MEHIYKQFVALATRWKDNLTTDEFFIARLRLTFSYVLTAILILGGSSLILYQTLLRNLTESIRENTDPHIAQSIIDKTQDILQNRFFTIDGLIVLAVFFLGFLLTKKTLKPIREAMEKQKRFIADASHELRTPTSIVISGLEVALRNKNLDLYGAKQTLENTLTEMREFSKLSNTLLDISKYEKYSQAQHVRLHIEKVLKDACSKMKPLASIKHIDLTCTISHTATIKGNELELHRVLYNIINNAIAHTPVEGTISIQDSISSHTYIIIIHDTGIGIEEKMIEKIFDPFVQGDASRHSGGAGLGLTLTRKIMDNHKGTIVIQSKVGIGTTVFLGFPIVR